MATRQQVLNYAIANKKSIGDINRMFKNGNMPSLNAGELSRLSNVPLASDNPLIRLGQNAVEDATGIAKGLRTFGAMGVQEARKLKQHPRAEAIKLYSGAEKYAKERGLAGAGEDLSNLMLSTYNTKVSDFGQLPAKQILKNMAKGAYEHPVSTALDLAPLAKVIPKGGIAKALHALPIPEGVKAMVPTQEMSRVNDIIKNQKLNVRASANPTAQALEELGREMTKKPQPIARNLITGDWAKGSEDATQRFLKVQQQVNKDLQTHFGLNPETTRREALSKYVLEQSNPTRTKPVNVSVVKNAMDELTASKSLSPKTLKALGITEDEFVKHIVEGTDKYDAGKMAHLSEVQSSKLSGVDVPEVEKNSFLSERTHGFATPEDIQEKLIPTYHFLNDQISRSKQALGQVNDVVEEFGSKVNKADLANIKKNQVVISPKMVKDMLGKNIPTGARGTDAILENIGKGITAKDVGKLGKYGDNLYVVDKGYIQQLINGNTVRPSNKLLQMWKQNVLAHPSWITGNRVGNLTFNSIEGVSPIDYAQAGKLALKNPLNGKEFFSMRGKYSDYVPEQLKEATSFSGYLTPELVGSSTLDAMKTAGRHMVEDAKAGKVGGAVSNFNTMLTSPVYSLESQLERTDRWANMVKQAKDFAKENKLNPDEVIKSIKDNPDLFNYLNKKVDLTMGDYVGRNYALNPAMDNLGDVVPFYRWLKESSKVMGKQAIDRPLGMQASTLLPAKYGKEYLKEQEKRTGITPEKGGRIFEMPDNRYEPYKVETFRYHPFTTPMDLISQLGGNNTEDLISQLNPVFNNVANTLNFRDKYGNILEDPKWISRGGVDLYRDENGRPTPYQVEGASGSDRAKALASLILNNTVYPVSAMNRDIMPLYAMLKGEGLRRPYPTSLFGQVGDQSTIPFIREGVQSRKPSEGMTELIGSMFGVNRNKEFTPRTMVSRRQLKGAFRKYSQQLQQQKEGK